MKSLPRWPAAPGAFHFLPWTGGFVLLQTATAYTSIQKQVEELGQSWTLWIPGKT